MRRGFVTNELFFVIGIVAFGFTLTLPLMRKLGLSGVTAILAAAACGVIPILVLAAVNHWSERRGK